MTLKLKKMRGEDHFLNFFIFYYYYEIVFEGNSRQIFRVHYMQVAIKIIKAELFNIGTLASTVGTRTNNPTEQETVEAASRTPNVSLKSMG